MMDEPTPLSQVIQAYEQFSEKQLILFLKIRKLPISGPPGDLARRLAHHDLHTYHFPNVRKTTEKPIQKASIVPVTNKDGTKTPDLPIEIIAAILEHLGDWELAQALGIQTSIPQPNEWIWGTRTDWTMLHSNVALIRAADPCSLPPTRLGATVAIRMGYVNVLEYFLSSHHSIFLSIFKNDLIPIKASRYGRLDVLSWWKHGFEHHSHLIPPPVAGSITQALNAAARHGKIESLDWWMNSGLSLEYNEELLEQASARNQISVLDWWLRQHKLTGLAMKIGRVMDMASTAGHVQVLEWWAASRLDVKWDQHAVQQASCHGKVNVLDWWLKSGLQLKYDADALISATRHNRPEVLEWWDKSGLPIQYRMCDIEEALEEAIGGGFAARAWWERKGVDFNANDKEWMKSQTLN